MPAFSTRLTPALVERYTRSGHWTNETFYQILARRAAAHPDRVAVIAARHRVTYAELLARVDRTAAAFQAAGVGPRDVVTIQLPNWVEFAYVFLAMERIGAIANQIGPDFRSREVEYILRFSESRAFVCPAAFRDFEYVPMIRELRAGLGAGMPGGDGVRLDASHPRHLDEVAAAYPDLIIVASRPAWPWQTEMIAILLHKVNVWYELHGWSPR